jgi:hypothetical protein
MTMRFANDLSEMQRGWDSDGRDVQMDRLRTLMRRAADLLFRRSRRIRPMSYGGRAFSTPQLMGQAVLPPDPGLYAIHVRSWLGEMKLLHFGASQNLHEELMVEGPEGFLHWLGHRAAGRGVWVSYHLAHELDHDTRHHEGARLNRHYFPQRTHSLDEHLARHRVHRPAARRQDAEPGAPKESW